MSNRYLLARQFQALHGLTVEDALAGRWVQRGRTQSEDAIREPEEFDEFNPSMRKHYGPYQEHIEKTFSTNETPTSMLREWAGDHRSFLVGNTPKVAHRIRQFTQFMDTSSAPNSSTIYRGARVPPAEQIRSAPDTPLSFSEDPHVARSFTAGLPGGSRGHTFKVGAGQATGVRLADYGADIRTVGKNRRMESEFLALPESIKE